MAIHVKDIEELAIEAVKIIYQAYLKAVKLKGAFTLVLSGGNTPKYVFNILVNDYLDEFNWKYVHLFWLDERCVDPQHSDSNFKLANDFLIKYIPHFGSIHRIKGEIDPVIAANQYSEEIRRYFAITKKTIPSFDIILLGMGEDGHCASLFPESDELLEKERIVVATKKIYNGHRRVSLTLPTINNSQKILMITSKEKREILSNDLQLPINLLNNKNMTAIVVKGCSTK